MIISASRRTDIPAFYPEWMCNRLRDGFAFVRNPFNRNLVSRVALTPSSTDCIVFWTKNPAPLLARIDELESFAIPFYFLFTLNPYDADLETGLPPREAIIHTFRELADRIGPQRVRWRYDPIILTNTISPDFHFTRFEKLARALRGSTDRCVISFLHLYRKCRRNLSGFRIATPETGTRLMMARRLAEIASEKEITLEWCAPEDDITGTGILPGRCVDGDLVDELAGKHVAWKKDPGQRKTCGCAKSVDIGAYDSCPHGCLYCYANSNHARTAENLGAHDQLSPMLIGHPRPDDTITDRNSGESSLFE
jgi:hypothetical protein